MNKSKRVLVVLIVGIAWFVFHTLKTTGFFRQVTNHFEGEVITKIAISGAEDITISISDSFAIVSSTKREAFPLIKNETGGLYLINLKNEKFSTKFLSAHFNKPFAPHGISMLKLNDSAYKIMAINHTMAGHSIEVFKLINDSLHYIETIKAEILVSPNDIVIVDENRYYFTNDHGYTSEVGVLFEEYLGLSVSDVMYFNGNEFIKVADGIAYANGINIDKKRNLLYVASPRGFFIKVYSINTDGSLAFIEDIACGMGVDNIELDEYGNLWVAGHPDLLHFKAYVKGKKKTTPSEVIKITYKGKNDYLVKQIYTNIGNEFSASTVASPFGDVVLVGNLLGDSVLVLKPNLEI